MQYAAAKRTDTYRAVQGVKYGQCGFKIQDIFKAQSFFVNAGRTAQRLISQADLVPECWIFCLKIENYFVRKDIVLTIRGSDMMSEGLAFLLIHLRPVGKHSNSNGCMYREHSDTFPWLMIWRPTLLI